MDLRITSLESIRAVAKQFLQIVGQRRVVALYGAMGAGKTTFVKALCQEMGVADVVTSPTFAIVNEYTATPSENVGWEAVYHFDFYRIKRLEEVYDMGYEDYFYGGGLCLIEWPELVEGLLPDDTLRVHITEQPDGSRLLSVED